MLLVNNQCFQSWLDRKSTGLQSRLNRAATIDAAAASDIRAANYWDKVRAGAEGGDFQRIGSTARIDVIGALSYKWDIWQWLFDSDCYMGIANKVNAAAADSNIKKIVLYVDSPGGTTSGLHECSDAIYKARAESGREVIAVVDPTAASAAYWIASQCSRVVCLGSGWVGSVGAQWEYVSVASALEQQGVKVDVLRSAVSPHKNSAHPYEPIKEEAKEEWQAHVDTQGEVFVQHVARGRGLDEAKVRSDFGGGRMLFAKQAFAAGMIDEIGSLVDELQDEKNGANEGRIRTYESVSFEPLV